MLANIIPNNSRDIYEIKKMDAEYWQFSCINTNSVINIILYYIAFYYIILCSYCTIYVYDISISGETNLLASDRCKG